MGSIYQPQLQGQGISWLQTLGLAEPKALGLALLQTLVWYGHKHRV